MFFSHEAMFKPHWICVLGAYVAFNNVISQSVLQTLMFVVELHEIEKYCYFYSSGKLKHRNKKELTKFL